MKSHKKAQLTFGPRLEKLLDVIQRSASLERAAPSHGVTDKTARKWLGSDLALGEEGLVDAYAKPAQSPRSIEHAKALAIVELRNKRLTQERAAQALRISKSTAGRVWRHAELPLLTDLEPAEPRARYEHEAPSDMLHIDIKKLGRIERPEPPRHGRSEPIAPAVPAGSSCSWPSTTTPASASRPCTPTRRRAAPSPSCTPPRPTTPTLGVTIRRLLTDNGSAFRSKVVRPGLPRARHRQALHPPIPPADQRQGRAVHPVGAQGVGLRLHLPALGPANRRPRLLDAPLQLAPPTSRHSAGMPWPANDQRTAARASAAVASIIGMSTACRSSARGISVQPRSKASAPRDCSALATTRPSSAAAARLPALTAATHGMTHAFISSAVGSTQSRSAWFLGERCFVIQAGRKRRVG